MNFVLVTQSCLFLCDPTDCSWPGSSVLGILQARILEWISILFSRGSSRPRNRTRSPAWQADALPTEPPRTPSSESDGFYLLISPKFENFWHKCFTGFICFNICFTGRAVPFSILITVICIMSLFFPDSSYETFQILLSWWCFLSYLSMSLNNILYRFFCFITYFSYSNAWFCLLIFMLFLFANISSNINI